jgi:hypothetical protein
MMTLRCVRSCTSWEVGTTGGTETKRIATQTMIAVQGSPCALTPLTLMLVIQFRERAAVYSADDTKHINTLCWRNAGLLNVEERGAYSKHCVLTI